MSEDDKKMKIENSGLPEEVAKTIKKKIFEEGYNLKINPDNVEVVRGHQTFGSGGYNASWKVWHGDITVIDKEKRSTSFISKVNKTIVPSSKPTAVSCSAHDTIGGTRWFKRFVAVWY